MRKVLGSIPSFSKKSCPFFLFLSLTFLCYVFLFLFFFLFLFLFFWFSGRLSITLALLWLTSTCTFPRSSSLTLSLPNPFSFTDKGRFEPLSIIGMVLGDDQLSILLGSGHSGSRRPPTRMHMRRDVASTAHPMPRERSSNSGNLAMAPPFRSQSLPTSDYSDDRHRAHQRKNELFGFDQQCRKYLSV